MSTRASILVKDNNDKCYLYHHHDGYPDGVGQTLVEYLKTKCGFSYWDLEEIVNELIKLENDEYEYTTCIHGDEEYFYLIDCYKKELSYTTWSNENPVILYKYENETRNT